MNASTGRIIKQEINKITGNTVIFIKSLSGSKIIVYDENKLLIKTFKNVEWVISQLDFVAFCNEKQSSL